MSPGSTDVAVGGVRESRLFGEAISPRRPAEAAIQQLEVLPGSGSPALVELAGKSHPSPPSARAGGASDHEGERTASEPANVLVVDDDQDTLDIVSRFLSVHGYAVASASNGQEALEYLQRAPLPNLILLDLVMPIMGGAEFLRRKGRAPLLESIPVVVISGEAHVVTRSLDLAAVDFLPKPVDVDLLLSVVRRHCRGPTS